MWLFFFLHYSVMISMLFLHLFLDQILKMHACHESSLQACMMSLSKRLRSCCWQYFFPYRACHCCSVFVINCQVPFEQGAIYSSQEHSPSGPGDLPWLLPFRPLPKHQGLSNKRVLIFHISYLTGLQWAWHELIYILGTRLAYHYWHFYCSIRNRKQVLIKK